MRLPSSRIRPLVIVPALALGLALASCSSGGAGSASGPTVSDDDLLATAREQVAAAADLDQDFPLPSEPAPAAGRAIAVLAGGFAAAIHAQMADHIADAVEASGATTVGPFDGEFTPSVQAGYIDQAVQSGADAVVLFAVDVSTVSAAVDRALADDVAVVCTLCYSGDYRDEGVVDVTPDFEKQGETIAWNMIARTDGQAKVLVTDEPSQTAVVQRVGGMTSVLDQCGGCSYETLTIPAADLALPGPPQFTAFLSANSGGFTDVAAYADALASPILRTLSSTGGGNGLVVSGYDAEETVVPELSDDASGFVADMAAPLEYVAWAGVDQALRVANGLDTWDSTDLPTVLLTPENADRSSSFVPAGDWKGTFESLWQG